MNPKYFNIGKRSDKVIEECAELIKEICKSNHFGLENWHPEDKNKIPNRQRILREIGDCRRAMDEYEAELLKEE